jgi:hypothetical protein
MMGEDRPGDPEYDNPGPPEPDSPIFCMVLAIIVLAVLAASFGPWIWGV